MEKTFGKDLFPGMLSFGYPLLSEMQTGPGKQSIAPFYEVAQRELSCFLYSPGLNDYWNEAPFLLLSDYLSPIPYGRAGKKAIEKMARVRGVDLPAIREEKIAFFLSLAFRLPDEKTRAYWKEELGLDLEEEAKIGDEEKEVIHDYFRRSEGREISLSSIPDIAYLFARFGHEIEDRFGTAPYRRLDEVEEAFSAFGRLVSEAYDNEEKFDLESYLDEHFPPRSLMESEERELEAYLDAYLAKEGTTAYAYRIQEATLVAYRDGKIIAFLVDGNWEPLGKRKELPYEGEEIPVSQKEAFFLSNGCLFDL